MSKMMSRRSFLGGTTALGAGLAAFGLAGCSSEAPADTEKAPEEPAQDAAVESPAGAEGESAPKTYDPVSTVDCDLVVVGGGNSGISCALEGAEAGLSVVLLEKEAALGGTLPGTEGIFGLGSKQQLVGNVELPRAFELVNEELVFTNYRTDGVMWTDVINGSGEDIDWLAAKGVTFPDMDNYLGQSKYDTFHWWDGHTGATAAQVLGEAVAAAGVNIMTSAPAVGLKVERGRVTGAYAQTADGVVEVAAKAVVLACGGMANDLELLSEKTGWDLSQAMPLYPINNTGDGLRMAREVGARETPVSIMNVFKVGMTAPTELYSVATTMQPVCLFVNKDAQRYVSEDLCLKRYFALPTNAMEAQGGSFSIIGPKAIEMLENDGCMIGVASVLTGQKLEGLQSQLDEQAGGELPLFKGDTIEELAQAMGLDAEALKKTVDDYNALCAAGDDTQFGKDPQYLIPLEEGPFYGAIPSLCVFATMGGIDIDRSCHVLDADGAPVPGLYSSGTASCVLYKETYNYGVSGGMNAYCCYTGRTAARTAKADMEA